MDTGCSAERQATYGAARCGGRQAVTGDDAICQIGSLRNGAIEGPTIPIRHCHRRPTCLAHGWTRAAHVGDRSQTGPCAGRTRARSPCFGVGLGSRDGFCFPNADCEHTAQPARLWGKMLTQAEARALVALKLARPDGRDTTMLSTRRLSSRGILTRTPRTRS